MSYFILNQHGHSFVVNSDLSIDDLLDVEVFDSMDELMDATDHHGYTDTFNHMVVDHDKNCGDGYIVTNNGREVDYVPGDVEGYIENFE